MRKLFAVGIISLFAAVPCAADYVYLQKEPMPVENYPTEGNAADIVLSGRSAGSFTSAEATFFSGVSRKWSAASALDGTKPIGMQLIFR